MQTPRRMGMGASLGLKSGRAAGPGIVLPALVPATHWRIASFRNSGDGGYTAMHELQWLDSAGVPISAVGATLGGTAAQAGSHAALYDGTTGGNAGFLQVGTSGTCTFEISFLALKTIGGVKIWPSAEGGGQPARAPGYFDIQYSLDNKATWNTLFSVTRTAWVTGTPQTFMCPGANNHRFWKLRPLTVGNGPNLSIAELQFREALGVAQTPSGGAPIFFSQNGASPAVNAFDGNASTFYNSGDSAFNGNTHYIGYDYGALAAKRILQVAITARNDGWQEQAPTSGIIKSSEDGISWVSRKAFSGLAYANGGTNLIAI